MAYSGGFLPALKLAKASGTKLFCGYCGTETAAIGGKGICSNCEMPLEQDRATFSERNAELFQAIASIKSAVEKGDFDGAAKMYGDAFAKYHDPGLLYAESLVRIKQSNAAIAQIRYDRKGFMEENTAHRNEGAQRVSDAKLLLTKAISVCNSAAGTIPANGNAFLLFLCYSRMDMQRAAKNAIGIIEKSGNTYLGAYARMAHDAAIRDYAALEKDSETMLSRERFSVNALFYAALAKLKRGDEEGAKRIAKEARKVVKIESLESLQKDIERFGKSLM